MGFPSIRALERRLTLADIAEWQEWEKEHGPVLLHERIEAAAQLIAYTVHVSAGGKQPPERFRMEWRANGAGDPDRFFRLLGMVAGKAG